MEVTLGLSRGLTTSRWERTPGDRAWLSLAEKEKERRGNRGKESEIERGGGRRKRRWRRRRRRRRRLPSTFDFPFSKRAAGCCPRFQTSIVSPRSPKYVTYSRESPPDRRDSSTIVETAVSSHSRRLSFLQIQFSPVESSNSVKWRRRGGKIDSRWANVAWKLSG